ncbi:MAG: hypothetical protein HC824_05535 [Synechococcales cyanobacterium RM1_1_8]|nr:hypothetical protein [Synechococcales cyanobacterium RM1_1_8]
MINGSLTPSEILGAWQAGAPAVKVFPITAVGGVAYLRQLREPLAGIPLIPTGGIGLGEVLPLLAAGGDGDRPGGGRCFLGSWWWRRIGERSPSEPKPP